MALREIALRRCADRVNKLCDISRIKSNSDYYTDEHILVCLSASPTNQKIIRTAARMAKAFKGSITALFVETPDFAGMSKIDKIVFVQTCVLLSSLELQLKQLMERI